MLKALESAGHKAILLSPEDSPYGSVDTYEQSKKCAKLFKAHASEIDGIIVTLPNFGEERGVADAVRLANLNVPVLIHAFPDDLAKLDIAHRRDSFCGKMSSCNNLYQYGIPYSLTEGIRLIRNLRVLAKICVNLRGLPRLIRRGARFEGWRPVRPPLLRCATVKNSGACQGISVESVDLSEIFGQINKLADNDAAVAVKLKED